MLSNSSIGSVVCTLFEKNYHYGVAALINSLHRHGFRGQVFIGYKGKLPEWAGLATEDESVEWRGSRSLQVLKGIYIHFLPVGTTFHLTNYKPAFMLQLLEGVAKDAAGIVYFDPDIVVKCRWEYYENWISQGVALVHEITSNDMPPTHPIRGEWEKVIYRIDKKPARKLSSYINGGFCGVNRSDIEFLLTWDEVIKLAIEEYQPDPTQFMSFDRTYPFYSIDQDALNISAMCSEAPISEMGPEAMDFIHGGVTMSHAVGSPKPWTKQFISSALTGRPPSLADKAYWANVAGPISNYTNLSLRLKRLDISIASFIGRFYRRY